MKRSLLLICIGSLALALTARAQMQNNPPQKTGPQGPTALARRGGMSNVGQMGPQRTVSTARFRQPTFRTTRTEPRISTSFMTRPAMTAIVPRTQATLTNANKWSDPSFSGRPRASSSFVNRSLLATTVARGQTGVAVTNSWRDPSFSGRQYTAFRNYRPQWHDSDWWWHHHDQIVFVTIFAQPFPFFFDAGYWYPAWGYYPNGYYPYDGPIYSYNDLPPDEVIANVQIQLQNEGYYAGPIDGVLGPETRVAIADYQRDHGLAVTAAIDEPTVASLGLI